MPQVGEGLVVLEAMPVGTLLHVSYHCAIQIHTVKAELRGSFPSWPKATAFSTYNLV